MTTSRVAMVACKKEEHTTPWSPVRGNEQGVRIHGLSGDGYVVVEGDNGVMLKFGEGTHTIDLIDATKYRIHKRGPSSPTTVEVMLDVAPSNHGGNANNC